MRGKPRVSVARGENYQKTVPVESYRGSPPRMRGKRSAWEKLIDEWRITPADAGKTPDITKPVVNQ